MKNKQDSWDELTTLQVDDSGASFELAGILLSLHAVSNNYSDQQSDNTMKFDRSKIDLLSLSGRRLWVFKRLVALYKQVHGAVDFNMAQRLEIPQNYRGRVKLLIPYQLFTNLTSFDPLSSKRKGWHWLRGLYGNCGNVFAPRTGYHLVLRITNDEVTDIASKLLDMENCRFSRRVNGDANEIMLRSQDTVVFFLNGIGLSSLALATEDRSIMRSVRDRTNRIVNCDAANINKSVRAAEQQVETAKKIKRSSIYEKLPNVLSELIDARLENPSATLSDLGQALSPPVSKSTVRYRWNKIEQFISANIYGAL